MDKLQYHVQFNPMKNTVFVGNDARNENWILMYSTFYFIQFRYDT